MEVTDLPTLNACLNAAACVLVVGGIAAIRRGNQALHKKLMLAAVATSAAFLVSYLVYHFQVGSVRYQKTGAIRTLYLGILLTHTVLAAAVAPMVIVTVVRALKGRFDLHRPLGKKTYPIWIYVSVTGVIIYLMLYRF